MGTPYIYTTGFGPREKRKWLVYTISKCICELLKYIANHGAAPCGAPKACPVCFVIFEQFAYTPGSGIPKPCGGV